LPKFTIFRKNIKGNFSMAKKAQVEKATKAMLRSFKKRKNT
jgi:hypothetical protein